MSSLKGQRVLVTGATGFIGSRLVERLILEEGAEVVALVHQFRNASRLARFSLRMIGGDVRNASEVTGAAEGCDSIVHCAVSFAGASEVNHQVTVEGARNVCKAARSTRARRLVHLSTFSVYGVTPPGPLTEEATKAPGRDPYGCSKLEAERVVYEYQRQGLPATILQPTVVYGPYSFWSTHAAQQLREGTVVLPNDGEGLCNAVFVDDVIDAILLSLKRPSPACGPFLISGEHPVTWRDYYLAHAAGIADADVRGMTAADQATSGNADLGRRIVRALTTPAMRYHLRGAAREFALARLLYRAVKPFFAQRQRPEGIARPKILSDTRPPVLPASGHFAMMASHTAVQITHAQTELGYAPKVDLTSGGALTREWLAWAGMTRISSAA